MKKVLFAGALALALGVSGFSYAQTQDQTPLPGGPGGPGWGNCGGGPGWHHGGGRGMGPGWGMARNLNLSQKQQDQINTILDKERTDTHNKIRAVLNADQRKIFDQQKAQRDAWRQQWQQRMQQQPAPQQ